MVIQIFKKKVLLALEKCILFIHVYQIELIMRTSMENSVSVRENLIRSIG